LATVGIKLSNIFNYSPPDVSDTPRQRKAHHKLPLEFNAAFIIPVGCKECNTSEAANLQQQQ
jgi:hypothetical protein